MIRQIEQQFGFALFHRTTHRVTLSDRGRAILPLAERLLVTAGNAFDDMRTALTHRRLAVRIGAMPSAVPMLAEALAKAAAADGEVELHLADGRNDELIERLRAGMQAAADQERFEEAAQLRDALRTVQTLRDRQQKVASTGLGDRDVFGLKLGPSGGVIQVFQVRGGRVVERVELGTDPGAIAG